VRSCLIDSGPLIALFAVDDHHHARFDAMVKELSVGGLRLITTWPCIVEASYLLEIPQRFEMLNWIELGGVVVYPFEPVHLGGIVRWMRRYREGGKREKDLADASLACHVAKPLLCCSTGSPSVPSEARPADRRCGDGTAL
jgi:uncharacterized protein